MIENNIFKLIEDEQKTEFSKSATVSINNSNIPTLKREIKIELDTYSVYDSKSPKQNTNRYYIEFKIKNNPLTITKRNTETLVTLLQNPSNTFPTEKMVIDETVQNVIKMAYLNGYKKIVVLNTKPLINGNSKATEAKYINSDNTQKLIINSKFIQEYLNNYSKNADFLVAWGTNKSILNEIINNEYIELINKNFKDRIWAYDTTKKNYPRHPGSWSPHNNKPVRDFLEKSLNQSSLTFYKINNDGTIQKI